jgi:hypothetical protein
MKKTRPLLALLALAACYHACYEDKGNYNYTLTNPVTITLPTSTVTAYLNDTLKIYPKITWKNPDDTTGFEYWWEYKGNMGLLGRQETICHGRELRFVPPIVGSQIAQLCVRETRTGVITEGQLSINAQSRWAKGWLVLAEQNNQTKLHFILPDRATPGDNTPARVYTPYIDLYQQIYPGVELGTGPVALRQAFSGRGIGSIFYILQDNEPACFNGISYQREINLAREFTGGPPPGLQPVDYYQGNYVNMLLDATGKVYLRVPYYGNNTDFFTYSFANFPMEYNGKPLILDHFIPSVADRVFFTLVLDRVNKRYLWMYAGREVSAGGMMPASYIPETGYLDYNNTANARILYTSFYNQNLVGSLGVAYIIVLYTLDGETRVQRCRADGEQLLSVLPAVHPVYEVQNNLFPDPAAIADNTKYLQLKNRNYLFLATGNKIYWYDHLARATRHFHTLPAGTEVIRMNTNPQDTELGIILTNGKFIILDIQESRLMETDNQLYEIDIPGRIVDMEYKLPNQGALTSPQYNAV